MKRQPVTLPGIDKLIDRFIEEDKAAGIAVLIEKDGRAYHRQYAGYADRETQSPIREDTIYRIFSMTKVVTAAALMQLFERGLINFFDPVEAYLPSFKDKKVIAEDASGKTELVPAKRPVTLHDLFTMTSGIPYPGDDSPAARAMLEAFENKLPQDADKEMIIDTVGKGPLDFHPGEGWLYGHSTDVLGWVLEAITGRSLGAYMKEHIFDPLGMKDTTFCLTKDQAARLCTAYNEEDGKLVSIKQDNAEDREDPCTPPPVESGGGGLFSTLDDYAAFARMLLNGGTLNGERVLGRRTVELMSCDHLTDAQRHIFNPRGDSGYGLCASVRLRKGSSMGNGSVGDWGWAGAAGTWFRVYPQENMTSLLMMQRFPGNHDPIVNKLMAGVYAYL